MKKLSVFIEGKEKTLVLDESMRVSRGSTILVKNVHIYWNYTNVYKGHNDTISHDGTIHTIPEGFWTFDNLKDRLAGIGITLTKNTHDSTCTMKVLKATKLLKFGELLGFEPGTKFGPTTLTSPNKVDVSRGLRFID